MYKYYCVPPTIGLQDTVRTWVDDLLARGEHALAEASNLLG